MKINQNIALILYISVKNLLNSFYLTRTPLRPTLAPPPIYRLPFIMVIFIFVHTACQHHPIAFKSFESNLWIAENETCENYRIRVIGAMEAEFDQFMGMSETTLISYLGKPDKTLLYTRGQKFFNYNLACKSRPDSSKILRIRFSALDQVNEVLVLD